MATCSRFGESTKPMGGEEQERRAYTPVFEPLRRLCIQSMSEPIRSAPSIAVLGAARQDPRLTGWQASATSPCTIDLPCLYAFDELGENATASGLSDRVHHLRDVILLHRFKNRLQGVRQDTGR